MERQETRCLKKNLNAPRPSEHPPKPVVTGTTLLGLLLLLVNAIGTHTQLRDPLNLGPMTRWRSMYGDFSK